MRQIGGKAYFSPLRLRIRAGKFREPDILLVRDANDPRRGNEFWTGADLVVEVVSPDKPERDLVEKRVDYAEGGIPEYWIVDPQAETITVLRLEGHAYVEHGVFARGETATSVLLPGFGVSVDEALDAD
jgi:Uma2 family endonuclease